MRKGLKNKRKSREAMDERRAAVEEFSSVRLNTIGSCLFDPILAEKNIENMIGTTQIPLGFVGPLKVDGDFAQGEFLVPMATTEGALLATVNRGTAALTASGGARIIIIKEEMTRAPVFRVRDVRHARQVVMWIDENFDDIRKVAESTTRHGKLLSAKAFANGRSLFVRFAYNTGDAMGMNMVTIATQAASELIQKSTGAVLVSVSGNFCVDKKPSALNYILGRGKLVLADALITRGIMEDKLKASPEEVAETCYRKNLIGSSMSLSYGFNAHVANTLAAIFIATGQDPAQVVEGSMGTTTAEVVDGGLYISLRLPSLEVGTIGGGTKLPCQSEALSVMGCLGAGKVRKFAEIVTATCLAGELSTLAAQAKGELASAHKALGR